MLRPMREKEDQTGLLEKAALGLNKHEEGGKDTSGRETRRERIGCDEEQSLLLGWRGLSGMDSGCGDESEV